MTHMHKYVCMYLRRVRFTLDLASTDATSARCTHAHSSFHPNLNTLSQLNQSFINVFQHSYCTCTVNELATGEYTTHQSILVKLCFRPKKKFDLMQVYSGILTCRLFCHFDKRQRQHVEAFPKPPTNNHPPRPTVKFNVGAQLKFLLQFV